MKPFASSLQKAVSKAKLESKNGGFETCFREGLDLSEFSSTSLPSPLSSAPAGGAGGTRTSASAALLKIKAEEKERRQQDMIEEMELLLLAERRREKLLEETTAAKQAQGGHGGVPLRVAPPSHEQDGSRGGSGSGFLHLEEGSLVSALFLEHQAETKDPTFKLRRGAGGGVEKKRAFSRKATAAAAITATATALRDVGGFYGKRGSNRGETNYRKGGHGQQSKNRNKSRMAVAKKSKRSKY